MFSIWLNLVKLLRFNCYIGRRTSLQNITCLEVLYDARLEQVAEQLRLSVQGVRPDWKYSGTSFYNFQYFFRDILPLKEVTAQHNEE